MEEGLIIMFVNVITKLCRCAAAGGFCPADPKDTAGGVIRQCPDWKETVNFRLRFCPVEL